MNNSNMKNSYLEKFLIDFIYLLYFIHMSLSYQPTANNCKTIWFSFKTQFGFHLLTPMFNEIPYFHAFLKFKTKKTIFN